ncbi:hypothetical protein LSTR_LSTR012054 [Laodelphax striatellus]|uniref:Choline/carnitine acyltransferase domain-containing protein n=1 Tax=Laodelphax striatellus TaxID=195883 RepID=A0A482WR56_LAOST|nr:hypothetical protein LSTR_LSTR012054 [Laodelphax striatellus]
MSMVDVFYILPPDSKERTFEYDKTLPSLPLPTLSHTLLRYLDSVKAISSKEDYEKTVRIVEEFENGIGKELHAKLQSKAANERNWLEEWWENYVYLSNRQPLLPDWSMSGSSPTLELGWTFAPGKQVLYAARYCYHLISLFVLLRTERYRPAMSVSRRTGVKKRFNMNQYRRLFSTCQVPGQFMDEMHTHFKTESEGPCPTHVVVMYNGHLYRLEPFHPDGSQLTTAEWEKLLTEIVRQGATDRGQDVAALTSDDRTSWAETREHIIGLSKQNAEHMYAVESSLFTLCLDEDCPESQSEVNRLSLAGDLRCRWADKALNIVFFGNGSSAGLCNHAAYDGIVSVTTMHFIHMSLQENRDNWQASFSVRPGLIQPTEILFDLDDKANTKIQKVIGAIGDQTKHYLMIREELSGFGKDNIQKHNLHPDAFIQMALQLAYWRMHGKPAPCYETATTRMFYNGRTETMRSCTPEAVKWCQNMDNSSVSSAEKVKLLKAAITRHVELMKEAQGNAGCDRHLFGLYCVAMESGLPVPAIFEDPNFLKSGGNGNFILSTSLVGYTELGGGVGPMCKEGYGCFYNITGDRFFITLSVHRDSYETSAPKFFTQLVDALFDMDYLLLSITDGKLAQAKL